MKDQKHEPTECNAYACVCLQKVQLKYHETTPGKVLINHEALQYPGQSGKGIVALQPFMLLELDA